MTEGPVLLESDGLKVVVDPVLGGTITSIVHQATGASVLGTVPWLPKPGPAESHAAPDEATWLRHYSGGWPILFPNGGDACTFDGVLHGFHGEGSRAAWDAEQGAGRLHLRRNFETVPVRMERELSLDGESLTIRERVTMLGDRPVSVMWGQHPTFGSDLLDGPFEIGSLARRVVVDDRFDSPGNPLQPGASGTWPNVPGKAGLFDLSRPRDPMAAMAYMMDFAQPAAWIRRLDDSIAAMLTWDAAIFPYAWLWCELGATEAAPWNAKTRLVGIEPNSTWPGNGLLDSHRRGAPLLSLRPAERVESWIRIEVTRPMPGAFAMRS
jgi:galactose mutarotase-like enzyme